MMSDITPEALRQCIEREVSIVLIDVREPWEYEEKNIGAKLFPLPTIPASMDQLMPYKNQEVILHCKSGKRSRQAKKLLIKAGFTNVRCLEGGIEAYLKLQHA